MRNTSRVAMVCIRAATFLNNKIHQSQKTKEVIFNNALPINGNGHLSAISLTSLFANFRLIYTIYA